jgi:hypothetical protein
MGLFGVFRRSRSGGPADVRARLEGAMAKRRLRGWHHGPGRLASGRGGLKRHLEGAAGHRELP